MKDKLFSQLHRLKSLLRSKPKEVTGKLKDYGYGQIDLQSKSIEGAVEKIRKSAFELSVNDENRSVITKIISLSDDPVKNINELIDLVSSIEDQTKQLKITIPNLPQEIKAYVAADLREIEKSFNSGCYRATIIVLARVLEACLHRKYFEVTGFDILEKNPGIGLGKLIAKLSDKNVEFDPGLTQQIHLINQVRIHSVHVKKRAFNPSAQQAYAMVLYTMDIVEKMF